MVGILDRQEIGRLSTLVEEATRSTREGVRRFVEPAEGTLSRAVSRRHHIIFGRRGSGKSSLLAKAAAELTVERRPIAIVDLEEFKGHAYPDVLISVLIKTLSEFEAWLKTAGINPASKKSFWEKLFGAVPSKSAIPKRAVEELSVELTALGKELNALLYAPEETDRVSKKEMENGSTFDAHVGSKIGNETVNVGANVSSGRSSRAMSAQEERYVHQKVTVLQKNIIKYKALFSKLSAISDGASFLFLDDLYHLRFADQANVLDYFHRIAKGSNLWLKVGTIRHRSRWYVYGNPPIGMKLGDDADEIDLDITLEKYDLTKNFLLSILENFAKECNLDLANFLADGAKDRLVLASGGVARDFLTIFRRSIDVARERIARKGEQNRGARIGAEDVNVAAGEYDKFKREDFVRDTDNNDRDRLLSVLQKVNEFCLGDNNTNCFLISKEAAGPQVDGIHELVDLKFLHQVRSRVTVRGETGKLFEAYMLDLSQYTGERKRRELRLVEFWREDSKDDLRKKQIVFDI